MEIFHGDRLGVAHGLQDPPLEGQFAVIAVHGRVWFHDVHLRRPCHQNGVFREAVHRFGGQNQRVAVARALANHPSIVIGDELTGNLDSKSSDMVYDLLRELNREMNQTFILVTHDMKMAEKTDRILRLVDGKIVCEMLREGDGFVAHDLCELEEDHT